MPPVRGLRAVRAQLLVLACLALVPACGGSPTSPEPAARTELEAAPTSSDPAPSAPEPAPSSSEPAPSQPAPSEPAPPSTNPEPSQPAPAPAPPPPPSDGDNAAWELEVVTLVNQRRAAGATCGGTTYGPAPALALNAALRSAARDHSVEMATYSYFSHTSYDGRTFSQRMTNAGYTGASPWGENIAAGQASPAAVVSGWMSSAGHCANIMNPSFRAIGVGYAFRTTSNYRHYWTQNFGGS